MKSRRERRNVVKKNSSRAKPWDIPKHLEIELEKEEPVKETKGKSKKKVENQDTRMLFSSQMK